MHLAITLWLCDVPVLVPGDLVLVPRDLVLVPGDPLILDVRAGPNFTMFFLC